MRPPFPNQSRGSRASLLSWLRLSIESAGLPRPFARVRGGTVAPS